MTRPLSLVYGKKTPTCRTLFRVRIRTVLSVLLLVFFVFSLPASASYLSEEFNVSGSFPTGSIVSIKKSDPESIELSVLANSEYLLGSVVGEDQGTVTFAKEDASVTVALTGEVDVLVSDANGQVKKGDFIGASWLEGVGMKSLDSDRQKLLGVALDDYSESEAKRYGQIDANGGKKDISIDVIRVRLFEKEGVTKTIATSKGLESILNAVAGREVSLAKVLASSILFLVTLIVSAMFIVSSIRGSFISIGRNPMASQSIYRSLLHVSGLSVLVLIIGTALTYVVLVV
jgi:hypothetical protein